MSGTAHSSHLRCCWRCVDVFGVWYVSVWYGTLVSSPRHAACVVLSDFCRDAWLVQVLARTPAWMCACRKSFKTATSGGVLSASDVLMCCGYHVLCSHISTLPAASRKSFRACTIPRVRGRHTLVANSRALVGHPLLFTWISLARPACSRLGYRYYSAPPHTVLRGD